MKMLLAGEVDAVIYGADLPDDPRLATVIENPQEEAKKWYAKHKCVPINHMVCVTEKLAKENPGGGEGGLRTAAQRQARQSRQAGRARHDAVRLRRGAPGVELIGGVRLPAAHHSAAVFVRRDLRGCAEDFGVMRWRAILPLVIPGRCEAAIPESRNLRAIVAGFRVRHFGRPGMTTPTPPWPVPVSAA